MQLKKLRKSDNDLQADGLKNDGVSMSYVGENKMFPKTEPVER